jgi:hypothetical protein
MNDNANHVSTFIKEVEDYSKTTVELLKLKAIDKSADIVSSIIVRLAIGLVAILSVLILSIGIALQIGESLDKYYYGFFVVGGFYVVVLIILCIFRNQWVKSPINNSVINSMLK